MIRETVEALFKAVTATSSFSGGASNKALDTLYDLFSQVIKMPYIDLYRMIDLAQYRSKFGKFPEAQKLLEDIGFRSGSSSQHLVFPYDQTLPRMMIAKELLHGKVAKKREEFSYSDVQSKLSVPKVQRLSSILGTPLLPKTSKDQRGLLRVSLEEVQFICDRTGVQQLDQYVTLNG